jgi:hypothetical protein
MTQGMKLGASKANNAGEMLGLNYINTYFFWHFNSPSSTRKEVNIINLSRWDYIV